MNSQVSLVEKLRWRIKSFEHKLLQYRLTTNETVEAETEYGKIKGLKRKTVYDDLYYSFEGIPYAQPPLGELRFKAPQRPTPWEGVLDCTKPKDKAVQINFIFNKTEGSEDCLYLNVYTNNLTPETARPVMVWIHGGGFVIGEANRDWSGPDYFMKKDVVLVTIQYRLGSLGFLSVGSSELNVPGNAGLKDQVMALKWIKNNCAKFGGNPDCITVFGESAGGASTHYMMLTDQTQGLFHRGITMSGNAMSTWACTESITNRTLILAKLAGYKGEEDDAEILKFLVNAKAKDLIRLEEKVLTPEERQRRVMFAFGPTVEPFSTPECVIPKPPREMMKNAWSNSIPLMLGCTSYEGLLWIPETKLQPKVIQDLETCVDLIPSEVTDAERKSDETKEKGLIIKKAHVRGEKPTVEDYLDLCSHLNFWFPLHRLVLSRFAHASNASMYLYRYDFDSEVLINPYRIMRYGRGVKGVSHADELSFLFWNILGRRMNKESREYRAIERTIDIWYTFALHGNPNNEKINGMESISWEPLKKSDETYKCLNISDELKFMDLPEMEKIKAWESLYDSHKELLF